MKTNKSTSSKYFHISEVYINITRKLQVKCTSPVYVYKYLITVAELMIAHVNVWNSIT